VIPICVFFCAVRHHHRHALLRSFFLHQLISKGIGR
jgi:hypothetical protein